MHFDRFGLAFDYPDNWSVDTADADGHYATVTVYRCPDRMCGKPCVTLRAFKMHAKCVHKGIELTPVIQEAKANFICKVRN